MNRITTFKLFELIKTLKKEEKRSFKLLSKKYHLNNDTNVYLKVFDYLDKQETLDRKKFKEKFKNIKGLSGIQTYLYQQLLKSLRNQQAHKNVDIELIEGLVEVEILFSKNLITAAFEKVLELQKMAEEHQRILLLPFIYEWWFKLQNTRLRYDDIDEETLSLYENQYNEIFSITKEYADSRIQLGRVIFSIKQKFSRQAPALIKTISDNLPPYIPYQKQSVPAEIAAIQLRAYLAAINRDTQEAIKYHQYLYDFTKQLPETLLEEHKRTHYQALCGVIINSTDWNAIIGLLEDFEAIKIEDQKHLSPYAQLSVISTKIKGYLSNGLLEESAAYIKEIAPNLDYPNQSLFIFLHYQYSLSNYGNKKNAAALDILEEIMTHKEATSSINYSSLLKIVILYEEQEYLLLSSYLNNVRRNFKKKEVLFDFEKRFISLMNKLISLPQQEHKNKLIEFRATLKEFLRTNPSLQREFLLYFNYLGWLDYQIDAKPFQKLHYWRLEDIEGDLG